MMMYTHPDAYQKLALASQLTPPQSPECRISPAEDEMPKANQSRLQRPRLPAPLLLVESNLGSNLAFKDKLEYKQPKPKSRLSTTYLEPTKNSNLAVSITEPVSPMSSTYSDVKGSFEISRPNSTHRAPSTNLTTYSSSSSHVDQSIDATKEISVISEDDYLPIDLPSPALSPQEQDDYQSYSSFSNDHDQSVPEPFLSRLDASCDSVQRNRRQAHIYEKELPPPPIVETPSPKTVTEPFPDLQPVPTELRPQAPQQDQIMCLEQSLEGFGYDKPSRGYFETSTGTPRQTIARAGVESIVHKVQPTYTVTVTAPRPLRRFSKLSNRSKESHPVSYPADPFEPITTIPQKSNGVESGAIAYLPRYTNTFAGFCKNAWRLQHNEVDKALNIKIRNSSAFSPLLKCKKCSYESTISQPLWKNTKSSNRKLPDARCYTMYGISYSWQFLFKSHVALKKKPRRAGEVDLNDGQFACIFCCAKGKDTPVFQGPQALAWHLRAHAGEGESFDPELRMRYKIIVGREPDEGESFDIFFPLMTSAAMNDECVLLQ